ncbi:DUF418 domain-containing protein [Novosphingobium sp. 9]|uniref:DUF418 domain-containing protein n=1 Tax=Novosphingobium sp. 9 TaxID=2025349 RepID=UPI0021B514D0|nr:DUF418 domain-containing protein [Novosphingobium sp. 9]
MLTPEIGRVHYLRADPRLNTSATVHARSGERLVTLDLIRGVAVLGILAINIAGFAGPTVGTSTPDWPHPAGTLNEAAFALGLVFFEGKMRALFSMLFGAGLALFTERMTAAGRDAEQLQIRRLFWLIGFGFAHYVLLWWGDILFVYGVCGLCVLVISQQPERRLLPIALAIFILWHLWGLAAELPDAWAEQALASGSASASQITFVEGWQSRALAWMAQENAEAHLPWLTQIGTKLSERPLWQIDMLSSIAGETIPLMLIGMAAYRSGILQSVRRRLLLWSGLALTLAGLAPTLGFAIWAWRHGFPPLAMRAALDAGLALPNLLAATGYGLLLIVASPALAKTRIGHRLIAAGRTAFSNYLGTSIVMTVLFQGWGGDLFGRIGAAGQWLFVLAAWTAMLIWSPLWLIRWRRGPFEWAWRSLTEKKFLSNRLK